jgi:uncharacterized membrane protein
MMATTTVNVHPVERLASGVSGATLLAWGLMRRSLGGVALALAGGTLLYRGIRGHSLLYQGLGINTAGESNQFGTSAANGMPEVERAITVDKSAKELHRLWREPDTFAQIMGGFAEIMPTSEQHLHWRVRGPLGRNMEWDTRVMEDRPGEVLRWESLEGAKLRNEGEVRFRPAPRDWGTETTLHLRFELPGGLVGKQVAKRGGIVSRLFAEKALRRFKSLAETGEIPTLEHNPSARTRAAAE